MLDTEPGLFVSILFSAWLNDVGDQEQEGEQQQKTSTNV